MAGGQLLGSNGSTPSVPGGVDFENLTTNGNFQIKTGAGVAEGVTVNTAGTTSTVALYDGDSATVTITIASPGVVTWNAHGLPAGTAVEFTTTGSLPSGLTAGTKYYVANDTNLTANTFAVSDTKAHALAGTNQINTSGSQSGTQTGWDVGTPIGTFSTTAQGSIALPGGAGLSTGLIAITAGGAAADLTVFYL